ncbi:MAG: hypothetical protein PUH33_01125 [Clostridiaceae bacterium]|nr:hypothetical protein [Clostridiaceae bacterium]
MQIIGFSACKTVEKSGGRASVFIITENGLQPDSKIEITNSKININVKAKQALLIKIDSNV